MNVTELIKRTEVKGFLLENFPKPIINRKEIFPEISASENKNPSLTGNAFEIFLRILSVKTKSGIQNEFENERKTALRNIKRTTESKSESVIFKDHLRISLNKDEYESKTSKIKKLLNKKLILFEEVSKKFKYSMIGYINDNSTHFKIFEKTNLFVASFSTKRIYSFIMEDSDPYTRIIDKDSLSNFVEITVKKFENECATFIEKRKLNKGFVELILEFTQISSQFYESIDVVKGLNFEESYLNYVLVLFNIAYQRKDIHRNGLLHHPTLKCSSILATPDFLIANKILEIKTSKDFFSTYDYLQAVTYLLLSQHSQNKKRWGVIKEIEIFYPAFDKSVKFKLKEGDSRIKPALKFLMEYSSNESKKKLKKIKAAMLKANNKKK